RWGCRPSARAARWSAALRAGSHHLISSGVTVLPNGCRATQGRRDSNPQPPVLETGALPIEPLPFGPPRRGATARGRPHLTPRAGTTESLVEVNRGPTVRHPVP